MKTIKTRERNKKILFIFNFFFFANRGTPIRINNLISEVDKINEFEIVTTSYDQGGFGSNQHIQLPKNFFTRLQIISNLIKREKFDLVVFHTINSARYLPFLKILYPKQKFLLEMHGFYAEEKALTMGYKDVTFYFYKICHGLIYVLLDYITTCSETATARLRKFNKNVHTVYGGSKTIDTKTENHVNSDQRNTIQICYTGNSRKWQGLDFLLDAYDELCKQTDKFSLHLVLSDEPTIQSRKNLTIENKIPNEKIPLRLLAADILVIPRPNNLVNKLSFPSKLMEYLASGRPVVASATSDTFRIIENGKNGLLYRPDDKDGFIEMVLSLLDPEYRKTLGINSLITARKFSWTNQGKEFISHLQAAMKE